VKLSRNQHHPLSRRVPVVRDYSFGGQLEEYIRIRFRWIAVQNSKTASRRHKGWAGPPLELSILRAPRKSLLRRRRVRLRECRCSDESQHGYEQTLGQPMA
jgi:hypothetical protein